MHDGHLCKNLLQICLIQFFVIFYLISFLDINRSSNCSKKDWLSRRTGRNDFSLYTISELIVLVIDCRSIFQFFFTDICGWVHGRFLNRCLWLWGLRAFCMDLVGVLALTRGLVFSSMQTTQQHSPLIHIFKMRPA